MYHEFEDGTADVEGKRLRPLMSESVLTLRKSDATTLTMMRAGWKSALLRAAEDFAQNPHGDHWERLEEAMRVYQHLMKNISTAALQ